MILICSYYVPFDAEIKPNLSPRQTTDLLRGDRQSVAYARWMERFLPRFSFASAKQPMCTSSCFFTAGSLAKGWFRRFFLPARPVRRRRGFPRKPRPQPMPHGGGNRAMLCSMK